MTTSTKKFKDDNDRLMAGEKLDPFAGTVQVRPRPRIEPVPPRMEPGAQGDPHEVAKSFARLGTKDPDTWRCLAIKEDKEGNERALPTLRNAVTILSRDPRCSGRITRDLLAGDDLLDGKPITDGTVTAGAVWIDYVYGVAIPPTTMDAAVGAVAGVHAFDPALEWAQTLPEWDGVPRLRGLFTDYFGVEPGEGEGDLVAEYGRCFMVAVMARIHEPGCQVDSAPVLAGPKGLRKSTGFAELAPKRDWFADSALEIGEKDALQSLAGVLMWELAELDSVSRRELGAVKAFMTSKLDKFRPSYGRRDVRRPRRCCFVGTVNSDSEPTFLREPDRRWWVMRCVRQVQVRLIRRDHAQLWAEARKRYLRGETWHISLPDLVAVQDASVRAYVAVDPWQELIEAYIEGWGVGDDGVRRKLSRLDETTTNDVLRFALGKDLAKEDRAGEGRVGKILGGLGWLRKRAPKRLDGTRPWVYKRPDASDLSDMAAKRSDRKTRP